MCSVMAGGTGGCASSKLLIPVAGSRWPMIVHLSGHHFMSERIHLFQQGFFRQRLTGGVRLCSSKLSDPSQVSLGREKEINSSIKLLIVIPQDPYILGSKAHFMSESPLFNIFVQFLSVAEIELSINPRILYSGRNSYQRQETA